MTTHPPVIDSIDSCKQWIKAQSPHNQHHLVDQIHLNASNQILSIDHPCNHLSAFQLDYREATTQKLIKSLFGHQPLRKALTTPNPNGVILDTTSGWAKDTLIMLALGHRVISYECHPWVYALTAFAKYISANPLMERWQPHYGLWQSHEHPSCDQPRNQDPQASNMAYSIDTVYMDPMFDLPQKSSAHPQNNMQWMRWIQSTLPHAIHTTPLNLAAWIKHARRLKPQRIVVKQPKKASLPLNINFTVPMKSAKLCVLR